MCDLLWSDPDGNRPPLHSPPRPPNSPYLQTSQAGASPRAAPASSSAATSRKPSRTTTRSTSSRARTSSPWRATRSCSTAPSSPSGARRIIAIGTSVPPRLVFFLSTANFAFLLFPKHTSLFSCVFLLPCASPPGEARLNPTYHTPAVPDSGVHTIPRPRTRSPSCIA